MAALMSREWSRWRRACANARCGRCGYVHEDVPQACEDLALARIAMLRAQHARDVGPVRGLAAVRRERRAAEIDRLQRVLRDLGAV